MKEKYIMLCILQTFIDNRNHVSMVYPVNNNKKKIK